MGTDHGFLENGDRPLVKMGTDHGFPHPENSWSVPVFRSLFSVPVFRRLFSAVFQSCPPDAEGLLKALDSNPAHRPWVLCHQRIGR